MININVSKEELLHRINIELSKHGMLISNTDELDVLSFEMISKDKVRVNADLIESDTYIEFCIDNLDINRLNEHVVKIKFIDKPIISENRDCINLIVDKRYYSIGDIIKIDKTSQLCYVCKRPYKYKTEWVVPIKMIDGYLNLDDCEIGDTTTYIYNTKDYVFDAGERKTL